MNTTHRFMLAISILAAGVVLGTFAGFPAEALHWERFSQAYEDIVVVTRAEYRADDDELRVRAESTSPTSTLSVYDALGVLIGVLERQDATRHEGRFDITPNPLVITVRSSEGGEATVLVTGDNPPTVTPAASATGAASSTATPTDSPTTSATSTATEGTPAETATPTATTGTVGPTASATPTLETTGTPMPTVTPTTSGTPPEHLIHLPAVVRNAELGG